MTVRRATTAAWPIAPALLLVGVALAATTIVPPSRAGRTAQPITANSLKPAACSALYLTGIRTGSGTFTDSNQPHLVLGSSGIDVIRGSAGDDCILGGGGNDSLRGDGNTDVCIGGPGMDMFFASCETQLQ
jgi:RTX calcium-binding nonapeptide repeat (4 copies)